jgi:hypothetical protein
MVVDDLHFQQGRNPPEEGAGTLRLSRVKQAGDVTGLLQACMRGNPDAPADLASLVNYELG